MSVETALPLDAAPSQRSPAAPAWLREPLLHFVLIGAALFALDHWLVGRSDDPLRITVSAEVEQEARRMFKAASGREPNAAELQALRQRWLDNEVLYREGLAMQVDRGDSAIRERVIFKSLSVVDANVKMPPYDDATLRSWFEARRARYDEPPRYDFAEAVLAGETSEAAQRSFAQQLNSGVQGDARASLRVFKGRPHANIVDGYGPELAKALEEAPVGEWRALASKDGWRVMRLEQVAPGRPAQFEAVRNAVRQDYVDATMAELRTAQVRALARRYRISFETAP